MIEEFEKDGLTYIRETTMGGSVIEYPKTEPADSAPPLPELPPTDVLTLEAVASLYEKTEALQAKVDAIENASFSALEGIAALAESQITE